jgi:hypothetical protein
VKVVFNFFLRKIPGFWISSFLLFLILQPLSGQGGYISTDSSTWYGIKVFDRGKRINSIECKARIGSSISYYSPDQLMEFGISSSRIYRSFIINDEGVSERYFLEKIKGGKFDIFFLSVKTLGNRFYLVRHSNPELIQIPSERNKYISFFENNIENHDNLSKNLRYLKLKRLSVINFLKDFIKNDGRPFPRIKYGITAGYSLTLMGTHLEFTEAYPFRDEFLTSFNLTFRFFADIPLFVQNLTLHPELNIQGAAILKSYLYNYGPSTLDADMSMKYSSLSVPIILRYNFFRRNFSPFVETGAGFSNAFLNKSEISTIYKIGNYVFSTDHSDQHLVQDKLIFITAGIGEILSYGSKVSFFSEIRGDVYFPLNKNKHNYINLSDISLCFGIMF